MSEIVDFGVNTAITHFISIGGDKMDDDKLEKAGLVYTIVVLIFIVLCTIAAVIIVSKAMHDHNIRGDTIYHESISTKRRLVTNDYSFQDQDVLSSNPERGFYNTSLLVLDEDGLDMPVIHWSFPTISRVSNLLWLKVDLSAFSGNMNNSVDKPLTYDAIAALRYVLEEIKQNNNSVILRFVYDGNADSIIDNKMKVEPSQDTVLEHISQLSQTFKDYASTINVVQIGFYGTWGECYYNTDVNSQSDYYKEITNALLDATKGTDINIALRTPSYYAKYIGTDLSLIHDYDLNNEDSYRVGMYNDSYGGDISDVGTYVNRDSETDWLSKKSEHTFYGGEAVVDSDYSVEDPESALNEYNDGMNFIDEAFKLHTSYLNSEWNQVLHEQWKNQLYTGEDLDYSGETVYRYIENHLGYRFVLKDVSTGSAGDSLLINIKVKNVGFGNVVKHKRTDVVITDNSGNVVKEYLDVGIDVKEFLSRTTTEKEIGIVLPELGKGKYDIYLRFSNGEILNDGKYYGAIRLANDNIWNESLCANYIATFTI